MQMPMKELFKEELRATNLWFRWIPWILILLASFITIMQLVFDKTVGDHPLPNDKIWILWVFVVIVSWLMWSMKLVTRITDEGVHVLFYPFSRTMYAWDQIADMQVDKYNPLFDPNNYGIRIFKKSKTYNVEGDSGLEIRLVDGRRIVVGTKQRERLNEVIRQIKDSYLLV